MRPGHTSRRTLAGILLAMLALGACTRQADRVQAGLGKAAQFVRDGQWDKARLETLNVLRMEPRNARAHALAAQVAEGLGDYPRAWTAWQQAAELDPADLDVQVAMARLQLLSGDTDAAARGLALVLARRPAHPGARTLRAAVALRRGQPDAALAELRDLVAHTRPPPVDASLLIASLLAQRGDRAAAVGVLDDALVAAPGNIALLVAAFQLCEGASNEPSLAARALDFHRRAALAAPQDLSLWRSWADFHLRRGETDQAEAVLRAAIMADPRGDPQAATLAWIDFLAARRGLAAATTATRAAVAANPERSAYRLRLAELEDDNGHGEEAEHVLRELVASDPAAPAALAAQDKLAERAFAAGRADVALDWLAKTLAKQPRDAFALKLRGRIALARSEPEAAVADLRSALHDAPGSVELAGLLAQAHRANGAPQLARDVLADAVRFRPDDPALRLLLAADMAESGDRNAADGELDVAIRQAPLDARAYAAKARLALERHDLAAAERVWHARLAAAPDDADAWLDVAAMRQLQHDPKGAIALFDAGERQAPGRRAIAIARAEWLARQGQVDAAIAAYEQLNARAPDDLSVANNLAWLLSHRPGDASALRRSNVLARALAASSEPRYLDTLGWIELRSGDARAATATLERAARLAPDAAPIQLHLGLALHVGGDTRRGAALLRKALASEGPLPDADEARRVLAAG